MRRLWRNNLVFKFFLSYLAVITLLFSSFYFYSTTITRKAYVSSLGDRMEHEARLLARTLPFLSDNQALDSLCRDLAREIGARITIIGSDGRVHGDSLEPSSSMENHAARPEVAEAIAAGTGSSVRYSTTSGHELLYRAFLQTVAADQRIIRLAIPLSAVEQVIDSLRRTLLVGFLGLSGLGLLLAYGFSRQLSARIKRLVDFSREVAQGSFPRNFFGRSGHDEIDTLERHLSEMSEKIRDNVRQVVAEKEKANSILRCMIEGVLVLDPKGRVLVINHQAQRMFHLPHDRDIHGASILEISRRPEMRNIIEEVLVFDFTSDRYSREVELHEGKWFRVNAVSLRNGQSSAYGSILVFHDITEIKQLETMRSDFVANVSHELRTPLTAIRGYAETLLQNPPDDYADTRYFLGIIEKHSERLSRLTEDLLTLSDLESGKIQLDLQPVDSARVIQTVLEMFWGRANKKQVKLEQIIEPGLPAVIGDFDRLQQLFINLVDNAVKYTPAKGTVTVKVQRAMINDSVGAVEISVSDTGPGIPEKDIPRLTERFYRVDKARSRELGGTGLGLAIVKHIAQAHGAELKIESVLQKGTTIRVLLRPAESASRDRAILFLCTGNSCRSQMAEGFARALAGNGRRIYSAGTIPKAIHPLAVKVMKEVGIDISHQYSKSVEQVPVREVDLLITLCDGAAETCATLAIQAERTHWPLADPALAPGDDEQILQVFRTVRDDIRSRVQQLFVTSSH
jgi:two-component system, OmpR family, phosphate regulon sensor histidine kinase PhoR